ncbi:hypothetical protein COOONC_08212 [Cooperia oncophora]
MPNDDRFTDTISRNTSVQSAIERFDQRKPMIMQSRPSRSGSSKSSPESTTSTPMKYSLDPKIYPAPPVPLPRKTSSPPMTSEMAASEKQPIRNDRARSNPPNPDVVRPARDDVIFHPMRALSQPGFRPNHFGAGITGVYKQTLNASIDGSEDDGYGDELDMSPPRKEPDVLEEDAKQISPTPQLPPIPTYTGQVGISNVLLPQSITRLFY